MKYLKYSYAKINQKNTIFILIRKLYIKKNIYGEI